MSDPKKTDRPSSTFKIHEQIDESLQLQCSLHEASNPLNSCEYLRNKGDI